MTNPFEILEARLSKIESLLLDLKRAPKAPEDLPDRISLNEACKVTGLRKSTIYKLTSSGGIPCFRIGERKLLFSRKELQEWLIEKTVRKQSNSEIATSSLQAAARKKLRSK